MHSLYSAVRYTVFTVVCLLCALANDICFSLCGFISGTSEITMATHAELNSVFIVLHVCI